MISSAAGSGKVREFLWRIPRQRELEVIILDLH